MSSIYKKAISPLPSHFYGLWSQYWSDTGYLTPPIHYLRETISNGALLVTAVGDEELKKFINSQKENRIYHFALQGQSLLDERRWLGHWASISIDFAIPGLLPPINPNKSPVPGMEGWM